MDQVKLDELFFPVGLHEAYLDVEVWDKNRIEQEDNSLFHNPNKHVEVVRSPRHLAVADEEKKYVFSYVTKKNYHLITNREVYEFGLSLVQYIYPPYRGYEFIRC